MWRGVVYVVNHVLITKYPGFDEGVGLLDGEHHIQLDVTTEHVQHAPRRVPVA